MAMGMIWTIIAIYMIGYAAMYKLQDNKNYQRILKDHAEMYNPELIQAICALFSWVGVIWLGYTIIRENIAMWYIKRKLNKVYDDIINDEGPEEVKKIIREAKEQLNKK